MKRGGRQPDPKPGPIEQTPRERLGAVVVTLITNEEQSSRVELRGITLEVRRLQSLVHDDDGQRLFLLAAVASEICLQLGFPFGARPVTSQWIDVEESQLFTPLIR